MVDIKNGYFYDNRLEDMLGEIIKEHNVHEYPDRHLIDVTTLSKQS